ncbi:uncharacterized protein [Bactrocera oleae]|uniref:uncharacterized protein isoform X2 n=1 Tax=Bactrocera oleae TaxID=104688 RepID=UPI0006B7C4C2|nr:MAP7 domain-containing protein 2 isoform X2 [Bactrocera oleae]
MKIERPLRLPSSLAMLAMCCCVSQLLTAAAAPQKGGAVRNIGMGEAMIQRSDISEKDAYYRRKRSLTSDELPADVMAKGPHTSFTKLMRNINAPCVGGGTGGGTGGAGNGGDGEDIVDEARRRIARMRARKAAAGKKSTNSKSKKKSGRRRRQVEAADLEGLGESEQAAVRDEFRAHMQQFTEKMNRAYEHIASSVMDMMKRMEENFYAEDDGS